MKVPKMFVNSLRKALGLPSTTVRNWSTYGVPHNRRAEVEPVLDGIVKEHDRRQRITNILDGVKGEHDSYKATFVDDGAHVIFRRRGSGRDSQVFLPHDKTKSYLDTEVFMAVSKLGRILDE